MMDICCRQRDTHFLYLEQPVSDTEWQDALGEESCMSPMGRTHSVTYPHIASFFPITH